ncbi:unnamed protein product, partial [Allacma fusca]
NSCMEIDEEELLRDEDEVQDEVFGGEAVVDSGSSEANKTEKVSGNSEQSEKTTDNTEKTGVSSKPPGNPEPSGK